MAPCMISRVFNVFCFLYFFVFNTATASIEHWNRSTQLTKTKGKWQELESLGYVVQIEVDPMVDSLPEKTIAALRLDPTKHEAFLHALENQSASNGEYLFTVFHFYTSSFNSLCLHPTCSHRHCSFRFCKTRGCKPKNWNSVRT